jgi:hypothetical protein
VNYLPGAAGFFLLFTIKGNAYMQRRIGQMFQDLKSSGTKAFIPFIMAGDPDLETTIRLVPELERAGSHIVELGVPLPTVLQFSAQEQEP